MNKWSLLILAIAIINIAWQLTGYYQKFIRPYDAKLVAEKYSNSQYVTGSGSVGIGDDGLYSFAGYYYIHGGDPSQVNFENPPLGKYLIGLSILLFNNENIIYLLYALFIYSGVYSLCYITYKQHLLSSLSVLLLSFTRLFTIQFIPTSAEQMGVTMLDLPLTMFLIFAVIFFIKANKKRKNYFLCSLFLGLATVCKFFPAVVIIILIMTAYIFLFYRNNLKLWLVSLLIIPVIYLLSYTVYFYFHPDLMEFVSFQKYIIGWRLGNPVVFGNIFRTILTGNYLSWWNNSLITDQEWSITLPVLIFTAVIGALIAVRKRELLLIFLSALSFGFIIYLAIGSVGVARYLTPVLPYLIILALRWPLKIIKKTAQA